MRLVLLRAAQSGRTVTYGRLMKMYSLPRGRRLSQAIGDVDRAELARGAPGFAAIIVRKDTGFPGGGYFCDDDLPSTLRRPRSRAVDPRLSAKELAHLKEQQRKIWVFYGGLIERKAVPRLGRRP
jgi:hypothetical protein